MGKGDKKSRRGKIILGSYGVRRPRSSKSQVIIKTETTPTEKVVKVKKVAEKPVADPKPKAKVADVIAESDTKQAVAPKKEVKKAVKKTKSTEETEKV
jgi:ribosomal small subunit protein bTHX